MQEPRSIWDGRDSPAQQRGQPRASVWLRLANDGDKASIVFLSEPITREVAFVDGKYVSWDETLREQGHKPSTRFALNVALYPSREVKVLEQGLLFFSEVRRLREKHVSLAAKVFVVERCGAANDPATTYKLSLAKELSALEARIFEVLPQHDLERLYAASNEHKRTAAPRESSNAKHIRTAANSAPALIDAGTATALTTLLRAFPSAATTRFCSHFGIRHVRELPAACAERAARFLEQLEEEQSRTSTTDVEVDPFA